jgi:3-isopropylmalate/(R)-2-methylmalate dehydratase small subunit
MAGIKAVLAQSVARIFFRNAINQGLPVLVCDTTGIEEGDELEVDMSIGLIKDVSRGSEIAFGKIPPVMLHILEEGGLVSYIRKYRDFAL